MKMKFKAFMEKVLAYFEENSDGIVTLSYTGMMIGSVVYIICACYSVLKYGISYRR